MRPSCRRKIFRRLTPTPGQVLAYNSLSTQWEPTACKCSGTVTAVHWWQRELTGGTINTNGTLNVDVGTTANKILQLNASAQIPAVDGSLLTNVSASANKIIGKNIGAVAPIANQVLEYNALSSQWEAMANTSIAVDRPTARASIYNTGNVGIGTSVTA